MENTAQPQGGENTMDSSKILIGKNAIVFGAGGTIGRAVAQEFASEGAEVFLSGRTKASVESAAKQIAAAGGKAHTAVVDALDDAAVDEYVDTIAKRTGRIDAVFNAVGPSFRDLATGKHAVDLTLAEFMGPVSTILKTQFNTARSVGRHMVKQRSGVIIFITGSPARGHVDGATALGAAFGAIETVMENMAFELGPHRVRVVCLRTTANTDSTQIEQLIEGASKMGATKEQVIAGIANLNFMKVPACVSDTGKLAALLASDRVRMMTGTVVNSTAGAALD
jgi:NAD(P)-dependent dehydrogenase (short-subunit alcohol dehydrogenase family)